MVKFTLFSSAALLLGHSTLTSALPQDAASPDFLKTCTPHLIATIITTTITTHIPTTTHACYTSTTTVRPKFCPINVEACPSPSCTKTAFTTVPCVDKCCPTTPTATVTACDLVDHCVFSGCTTVTATTTACL